MVSRNCSVMCSNLNANIVGFFSVFMEININDVNSLHCCLPNVFIQGPELLRQIHISKDFPTWLLIGWQLCCQPIRIQVWKLAQISKISKDPFMLHNQYHGWLPGVSRSQGISSHDIDLALPKCWGQWVSHTGSVQLQLQLQNVYLI